MHYYFSFFLSLGTLNIFSQNILTVRVIDNLSHKGIEGVNVAIGESKKATSNRLGFFQIEADVGDEIMLTHQNYEKLSVNIPDEVSFSIEMEIKESSLDFTGGIRAFYVHFGDGLIYPLEARKKKIQARLYVTFQIDSVGGMTNIRLYNDTQNVFAGNISSVFQIINGNWSADYQGRIFKIPITYILGNLKAKPKLIEIDTPDVDKTLSEIVVTAHSY